MQSRVDCMFLTYSHVINANSSSHVAYWSPSSPHRLSVLCSLLYGLLRGRIRLILDILTRTNCNYEGIKGLPRVPRHRSEEENHPSVCVYIHWQCLYSCQHRPIPKWWLPKLQLHISQFVAFKSHCLNLISVCFQVFCLWSDNDQKRKGSAPILSTRFLATIEHSNIDLNARRIERVGRKNRIALSSFDFHSWGSW